MNKPNTLLLIQASIINDFCDKDIADEVVVNPKMLQKFAQLYHEEDKSEDALKCEDAKLQGRFFLGLNVKTDSEEGLKPIPFFWPQDYDPKVAMIAEGGSVTDMFELKEKLDETRPDQDNRFKWNPYNWKHEIETNVGADVDNDENSAVDLECGNIVVQTMFRSPYGPDYVQGKGDYNAEKNPNGNKYNILGEIYHNALKLKKSAESTGDCYVLIHFFDYDLTNGKNLSFVLAVCELEEDRKLITDKLDDLINFIMLVKARYVRKIQQQRQVESMKSAVAAIMSRNMSHNLGSHYLYYTKNQLAKLADENQVNYAPDIRGAAKVLGYMQARMDYLATIVSGDKYPYGAVFFKGQIFDELTIDDFSIRHFQNTDDEPNREFRRTTNYLLQNLILSENFTRGPVARGETDYLSDKEHKIIRLQIKTPTDLFTGIHELEDKEKEVKMEFSKLTIALPGNAMSIHAFYNVVENLIRNSAKYMKDDFKKELVITIAINELKDNALECYEFVIYDNKGNAFKPCSSEEDNNKKLIEEMNSRLSHLRILNDKNKLDKSDKGLKEILFSTLWMRAYTYEKKKYMPDILAEIDKLDGDSKLKEISTHAFDYVAVEEKGEKEKVIVYKRVEKAGEYSYVDDQGKEPKSACNLGIRFEIPKYRMLENVSAASLENNLKEIGLNNFRDIICVAPEYGDLEYLKTKFTRVHQEGKVIDENSDEEAVRVLKSVLNKRFPKFDKYRLCMENRAENGYKLADKKTRRIYFKTHYSDLDEMKDYAYCEAISGENFTKTMQDIFENSFKPVFAGMPILNEYRSKSLEYFALKIKESALTRITLIDERLYKDMRSHKGKDLVLKFKNVRVQNLKKNEEQTINENNTDVTQLFYGNEFHDGKNATHFLSIHLSIIEKITKEDSPWVIARKLKDKKLNERVETLMEDLRKAYKTNEDEVFISVHSGRGNFSKELDESLKGYPFVSISAIENVYSNSKFLLAQLFYNTVYIGKGVTNE